MVCILVNNKSYGGSNFNQTYSFKLEYEGFIILKKTLLKKTDLIYSVLNWH